MDNIIFYKQNKSVKPEAEGIRLSYQREYTVSFATLIEQVAKIMSQKKDGLLFYCADALSDVDCSHIRQLQALNKKFKICLLSDEQFAFDAWRLQVFNFDLYPFDADFIKRCYIKFTAKDEDEHILAIKDDGFTKNIPYSQINYLQAAGNYTFIHEKYDRMNIQTKQIARFEFMVERDHNFSRVHRSFIVNLANVEFIGNKLLKFYHADKPLALSEALEIKIKKLVSGK